jgi:thiamine biosynthesis lipoprotein
MGTVFSFRIPLGAGAPPRSDVERLVASAAHLVHRHDELFSLWRPDSALSRLRSGRLDLHDAPAELHVVLGQCTTAKELSQGWFDPWAMPGGVDPTGLVKGWSAGRAMDLLVVGGIGSALLNAGGDLVAVGRSASGAPWNVGIRHPWRSDGLACVLRLDAAVATSGTYERGPHLVDPHTGVQTTRCASATVAGPDAAIADALATAIAVGGDDAFNAIGEAGVYEAYLIRKDGTERWTPRFPFSESDGTGGSSDASCRRAVLRTPL